MSFSINDLFHFPFMRFLFNTVNFAFDEFGCNKIPLSSSPPYKIRCLSSLLQKFTVFACHKHSFIKIFFLNVEFILNELTSIYPFE